MGQKRRNVKMVMPGVVGVGTTSYVSFIAKSSQAATMPVHPADVKDMMMSNKRCQSR